MPVSGEIQFWLDEMCFLIFVSAGFFRSPLALPLSSGSASAEVNDLDDHAGACKLLPAAFKTLCFFTLVRD